MKCKIISRMSRLTSSDGRVFAICSHEVLRHWPPKKKQSIADHAQSIAGNVTGFNTGLKQKVRDVQTEV